MPCQGKDNFALYPASLLVVHPWWSLEEPLTPSVTLTPGNLPMTALFSCPPPWGG